MEKIRQYFPKLSQQQYDQLARLGDLYREWNAKINVVSRKDIDNIYEHHVLHSMAIARFINFCPGTRILDFGTGGGFPGIPLAIFFPEKQFTLVDSLAKRMRIVQEMAEAVGLKNVTTVHGRAEELGQMKQYREKFDLCISRAVANLSVLAEYCLPFVKIEGSFIALKGPDAEEEMMAAEKAVTELGGALADIEEAGLFLDDGTDLLENVGHMLVHIDKESKTPKKYPRKAGTPSKAPLK